MVVRKSEIFGWVINVLPAAVKEEQIYDIKKFGYVYDSIK